MKSIVSLASFIILIFNSCCSDSTCDCFAETDRVIFVAFDTTFQTGYRIEEIDTIEIISLTSDLKLKESEILLLDKNSNEYHFGGFSTGFGFDINDKFRKDNLVKNYNIITQNLDTFFIRNIEVQGHEIGDKCCSCFTPDKKLIDINGRHHEFTSDKNGNFKDGPILLRRK